MNILSQIEEAERLYKNSLEGFFLRVTGLNLESHGIDHHRRVWAFARMIISDPGFTNMESDSGFIKKLLIASYLHDSGMVIDSGPRHGIHSRSFCEKFLDENSERIEEHLDLLDAIEQHDDKEYHDKKSLSMLDTVLNVADDMDAFGYTGIYRYLEIYLERKRAYETLGYEISNNAETRYRNTEKILKSQPKILSIQRERYNILESFFRGYVTQAAKYTFGTGSPSGYCGVAELIGESVEKRRTLEELISKSTESNYDRIINHFFAHLKQEIISLSNGL